MRLVGSLFIAAVSAAFLVPAAWATPGSITGTTPQPVAKAPAPGIKLQNKLWATVNVCDTIGHPDTVGFGASMPGSGKRKHDLYMRFQVQFRGPAGVWKYVGPSGDSDFQLVGTGDMKVVQAGHNFMLQAPVKGQIVVRGEVTFEWRKGAKVIMRTRRLTGPGKPKTAGADPKRFSAAICQIKPDVIPVP